MSSPTILIAGATGNTGKNVVHTLAKLISGSNIRILGLTRSKAGSTAKELASIDGVEMEEKDWTEIDSAWLKERNVVKCFLASHNLPSQYAEESAFHLALLHAGVKYVIRISTNPNYMTPDNSVYYGRAHWAIENLLDQPQFDSLSYTSLRPNFYTQSYLGAAAAWIKEYQKTGKQSSPLTMVLKSDVKVAMIDAEDVGKLAGTLLSLEDHKEHAGQKYIISGPGDVVGKDIVDLVEKVLGIKVENVEYEDVSFITNLVEKGDIPKKVSTLVPSCLYRTPR
jgi:uncharacterized protein YbjT (DUF2867 family)